MARCTRHTEGSHHKIAPDPAAEVKQQLLGATRLAHSRCACIWRGGSRRRRVACICGAREPAMNKSASRHLSRERRRWRARRAAQLATLIYCSRCSQQDGRAPVKNKHLHSGARLVSSALRSLQLAAACLRRQGAVRGGGGAGEAQRGGAGLPRRLAVSHTHTPRRHRSEN